MLRKPGDTDSAMRFAAVGGLTLHYTREGLRDGAPLVFINSLGTDLRMWDALAAHLAARFPIIRCDQRGHGLSDCPAGPYSIRDLADDLDGLLAYLEVTEAILIGISVGGMVALDYAAAHGERVRALVLCDTAARIGAADMWNARIEAIRKDGMAAVGEAILARWFMPDFAQQRPADYRGYYNMLVRTPAAGYTATCEALRDADLSDAAASIETRSLVLCGSADVATPPSLARGLAEALPDARFELIDQAAHLPPLEQPDATAAKIERFLRENGYVR